MAKRLISLLTASVIFLGCFSSVYADEDADSGMAEFDANPESQIGSEIYEDMSFFKSDDGLWVIPEFDTTGMTDFEIIRKNMYHYAVNSMVNAKNVENTVDEALSLYQDGGYWPGLDYWAYEIVPVTSARHFRYVQCMIAAYQIPESKYYKDEELYKKILDAMDFFINTVTRKYEKGKTMMNWWAYTIGTPMAIQPVLVLGYNILPHDLIVRYAERYLYRPQDMADSFVTATNAVWYAMNAVYRGVLLEDEATFLEGIEIVEKSLAIAEDTKLSAAVVASVLSNEGIQTDFSYHMHGSKFYSYSTAFTDFIKLATLLNGTKYKMTETMNNVIDTIEKGWLYTYHNGAMDVNIQGRGFSSASVSPTALTDKWAKELRKLAILCPERAEECLEYARYLLLPSDEEHLDLTDSKYFYRSEYLCHHKGSWTLFNQLNTRRSNASEYNCHDQIWGYWIGFGHTYLYKGDDPFYGSNRGQAVYWDWSLIPGTTSSDYVHEYLMSGYTTYQKKELFAGGISDGDYSMTAMKLSDRAGVSAKKSWFCFDDEYVSLGSDIESTSKFNVQTTVEQRRLAGEVEVDGKAIEKGEGEYKNVKSVLHYGIGYVFPEGEDLFIRNDSQTGSYATTRRTAGESKEMISEDMFTMYIPHKDKRKTDTYCYITIPETDSEKLAEYCENNDVRVIANNANLQAVYHDGVKAGGAVFYKNGTVDFGNGITVKSDSAACLLVRVKNGKLEVSVSNPYAKKTNIKLCVTYNGEEHNLSYDLPGYDKDNYNYGGKTVTKEIDL